MKQRTPFRPAVAGRDEPPLSGGERQMLQSFLGFHRATVVTKVHGLSDEEARTPLLLSSPALTPIGIVVHLTGVERGWFRIVMGGEDVVPLGSDTDPAAMDPDELSLIGAVERYEEECRAAEASVADLALDDVAISPGYDVSLRWVYLHMIEETARHNGHLDLLRENLDGSVGE